ncbi:calmodulin-binding protein 60 A-like isoform X2 [Punica granatum]|uniref:Uncharacterized protein n=2 Tax=Punica granatum TaxID=22663 RepID=A0A2I0LBI0_PUNGR|nr:calmodulin-binding protein 60 A-like isoform X2 [Punica granatum]PKI78054.1 hypothetical protein CRG98_001674 [Punica granatum]
MSPKRQQEDGRTRSDGSGVDDKRRRMPTFESVVVDMMKMRSVQHLLEPVLEPLIRKVVKEEVEIALRKHMNSMKRSCGKEVHASELRSLQLQFLNSLSLPVFTGARIEGEDCSALKVALIDMLTGQIVNSGPESLAKFEIVVLEGDFDGDEGENWTSEEFKNNIVREREGKKPLLTGEAVLNLKDGIGLVGEISFTDNSSWTRSRRFRLGVRVVDHFEGVRIKEAKTESFVVRDHRGELYKKHHPPSLLDEVWRLEKIGKDGAFHKRLSRENIFTVKDFLTLLSLDPSRLRNILGTGMSAKMWEVTVDHARTCVLDKRVYLYFPPPASEIKTGVVFNIIGQVMGLLSECQYVPIDKLSETQKTDAQGLVISAFQHWEDVVCFDEESSLAGSSSCVASTTICNTSSPKTENSNSNRVMASDRVGGFDYTQPSASSPDIISSIYSTGDVSGLDDYSLPSIENMALRYDQALSFPTQVSSSMMCDTRSITQDFFDEDHLQFFDADCPLESQIPNFESTADLQCAVDSFLLRRSSISNSTGNAQRRWTKLFSVLKWFAIRKIVIRRTRIRAHPERW